MKTGHTCLAAILQLFLLHAASAIAADNFQASIKAGDELRQQQKYGAAHLAPRNESVLATASPLIQIATWNDWGEGTVIEPSREFGYRDMEVAQELRRKHLDSRFSATAADLRLPGQLLELRRKMAKPDDAKQLDRIAELMATGELRQAKSALETFPVPP
jgi:hypothetical protein